MSFDALIEKVKQAETALEAQERQAARRLAPAQGVVDRGLDAGHASSRRAGERLRGRQGRTGQARGRAAAARCSCCSALAGPVRRRQRAGRGGRSRARRRHRATDRRRGRAGCRARSVRATRRAADARRRERCARQACCERRIRPHRIRGEPPPTPRRRRSRPRVDASNRACATARPRPRASTALLVLATLAVGYTLWAAQDLILPVLLAMFFALVGNPIIRLLQRLLDPALRRRAAGAGARHRPARCMLGRQLVAPAGEWMRQVPRADARPRAEAAQRWSSRCSEANKAAENIARAAGGETRRKPVQVVKTEVNDPYKALTATPRMLASVLAVVLLTFFFMVYGQSLQRNAIALLPGRQQKRLTVEILQSIEHEISRYVLTISVINVAVRAGVRRRAASSCRCRWTKRCCGARWRRCSTSRPTSAR